MNELKSSATVPSLHHRKEGWLSDQQILRSLRLSRGRGGFPMRTKGKPPRLRPIQSLREIFLMTQPPLLAVMQGGDCRAHCRARFQFIHTFIDRPYRVRHPTSPFSLQATNRRRSLFDFWILVVLRASARWDAQPAPFGP